MENQTDLILQNNFIPNWFERIQHVKMSNHFWSVIFQEKNVQHTSITSIVFPSCYDILLMSIPNFEMFFFLDNLYPPACISSTLSAFKRKHKENIKRGWTVQSGHWFGWMSLTIKSHNVTLLEYVRMFFHLKRDLDLGGYI